MPLSIVLVFIVGGLVIVNRRKWTGRLFILLAIAVLYVLSLAHVADWLLRPLEGKYPPFKADDQAVDAVVVPGGGSVDLAWMNADPVPNAETLSRLVLGVELAKKLKVPLVVCGGNGEPFATTIRDADPMAKTAEAMGISKDQLIVERESRNTLENARAVRHLLHKNRIILATSAYYMRRAKTMFERQGFIVMPAPTYFLAQSRVFTYASFIPKASDFYRSSIAIAEWISLGWWTIRGEI